MSYCCVFVAKSIKAFHIFHISHTSPVYSTLSLSILSLNTHTSHHSSPSYTTVQPPPQWSVEPSTPSGKSGKSGVHTGPHPKPQWEQHPPVSWGSEWHSSSGKSGKSGLTTTESSWWSPPPPPMPHEEGWGSSAKSNKESWWSPPPPASWDMPQDEEGGSWLQWGVSKATKHHKSSKSKSAKSMHIWNEGSGWWMSSDGKSLFVVVWFLCI